MVLYNIWSHLKIHQMYIFLTKDHNQTVHLILGFYSEHFALINWHHFYSEKTLKSTRIYKQRKQISSPQSHCLDASKCFLIASRSIIHTVQGTPKKISKHQEVAIPCLLQHKYRSLKIGKSSSSRRFPIPIQICHRDNGTLWKFPLPCPVCSTFFYLFHKLIIHKFGGHWERWRWMFLFVTLVTLLRRVFVSFPVKFVHVRSRWLWRRGKW